MIGCFKAVRANFDCSHKNTAMYIASSKCEDFSHALVISAKWPLAMSTPLD